MNHEDIQVWHHFEALHTNKGSGPLSQYSDCATGWMIEVQFPAGAWILSLHLCVQRGSGAHQSPIQWEPALKCLGHTADYSPATSAEVKNAWNYTSTPPIRLHGVVLY
jgi:hypothetical protein